MHTHNKSIYTFNTLFCGFSFPSDKQKLLIIVIRAYTESILSMYIILTPYSHLMATTTIRDGRAVSTSHTHTEMSRPLSGLFVEAHKYTHRSTLIQYNC